MEIDMKGFLLFCVFSGFTFAGFYKSYWLDRRRKMLRELRGVIGRISEEIRFANRPLCRLSCLSGMEHSLFGSVFSVGSYPQDKILYGKGLLPEDWEILDPFFDILGKTDVEGQISACTATFERLSLQEEKAATENSKKCRLYSYSGVLAGLFFVIILL